MNLKNAKKLFWDTEEETASGPYLVTSKHANIVVRNPQKFSDVQAYADALMAGSTVMVSYGDLDKSVRTRVFDYLNGVSYIIGAQVEKVNGDLIIYAPSTVGIDKEEVKKTRSCI